MPVVATQTFDDLDVAVARFYARRPEPGERVLLHPERPLDVAGFERFCARHPDAFAELEPDGTITLMSPQTLLSNENEFTVATLLGNWWLSSGRPGKAFGASAGFALPGGAVRSPDAAWVSPQRLAALSASEYDTMAALVPDFVVEVMSKGDSLRPAQRKMREEWMAAGVRLGWLLWPRRRRAYVYWAGGDAPEELHGFERVLDGGEVVPGFQLDLRELLGAGL